MRNSMLLAVAALAVACGSDKSNNGTKVATQAQAQQSFSAITAAVDTAFTQAEQHPATALTAAPLNETFSYSGPCQSGGTFDASGTITVDQTTDDDMYHTDITFHACEMADATLDGEISEAIDASSTTSNGTTTILENIDYSSDHGATITISDAGSAELEFSCPAWDLQLIVTITVTNSIPSESITGTGTWCGQPWQDSWAVGYQVSSTP